MILISTLGRYVQRNQFPILKSFLLGWGTTTLSLLIILSILMIKRPYPEQHGSILIPVTILILAPMVIGILFVISSNPLD